MPVSVLWGAHCQLTQGQRPLGTLGDLSPCPIHGFRQFGHLSHAEPACGGFCPLSNISVMLGGISAPSPGTRPAELPTQSPRTAPAQGTRPQEEAAAGHRQEGGEAGELLGEAQCPARPSPGALGLVGPPSPHAGGCAAPAPALPAACLGSWDKLSPEGTGAAARNAHAEFIFLLQAVPRVRIHHPWLGLAG